MPQLTANFFRQGPGESLAGIPRPADGPKNIRITHVLHPYAGGEQNQAVQLVTFETIRTAIRASGPDAKIRCVCVTQPDETHLVPADFVTAPPLRRTILDVNTFQHPRALPLV